MPNFKNSNATFRAIFKHCEVPQHPLFWEEKFTVICVVSHDDGMVITETLSLFVVTVSLCSAVKSRSRHTRTCLTLLRRKWGKNEEGPRATQGNDTTTFLLPFFSATACSPAPRWLYLVKLGVFFLEKKKSNSNAQCLKITEKVSFNIAYVYILSGQKFTENAKTAQFGEFWKPETCGQTELPDRSVFNRKKICGKCQNKKNSNATFWVIFKHCVLCTKRVQKK